MNKTKIPLDIWEMDLIVYDYGTKKQIEEEINKIQRKEDKIIDFDLNHSVAFHFQIWQTLYIFNNTKELPILVHELYHAVSSVYDTIWLPMSKENDEFWAYLISYIIRKLWY